jgi:mannose-6-phosphate isomerase-like protein (cupin superfamily)
MKEQQIATELETSEAKSFDRPDDIREFPHGRLELVRIGGAIVGRSILQAGWRWSESLQSMAQTESCEAAHFGYLISGTLRVRMDDGNEFECKAGDVCLIAPGHDAWVVGNEPVVLVDFRGTGTIAEYLSK